MTNLFLIPSMTVTSTALMANGLASGVDLPTPKLDSFHYEGPVNPLLCSARSDSSASGGIWGLAQKLWPFGKSDLPGPKAHAMKRADFKKLEQLFEQVRDSNQGSGRLSFRSLPQQESAVDLYYRNGQGFALIPKIRGAQVSIWRAQQEKPIVARKGKIRWLRHGDRVQISLNQQFGRPERAFVFGDLEPMCAFNGEHYYPSPMPDYFKNALREVRAKPDQPSRIVDDNEEMLGFLSYSPTLGYCLRPWNGHEVYAVTHHGARSTRLKGPNSTRLERVMIHDFMRLDSFDIIQFDDTPPFEIDYVSRGTHAFNDEIHVVRRAIMADYTRFLKAFTNQERAESDLAGDVAYRIHYNPNVKGFALELLCDSEEGIQVLPLFHIERPESIHKGGERIKLPLRGHPIVQIGIARPLVISTAWLEKLAKQWEERRDSEANETDIRMVHHYDILGISLTANEERVKKAFKRKTKAADPNYDDDPEVAARFSAYKEAYQEICEARGWQP